VQSLHSISGNGLIAVSLVQIVVMFLGRQFRLSWLTAWMSGLLLTLSAIALAWTAMNLDWTQLGYWRLNLELGTIAAIPLDGPQLRQILTGGEAISTVTIKHLFTLHSYVLSTGAIALSILHLVSLLIQEQEQKLEAVINAQPQQLVQQEPSPPHQQDPQKFNPDNPFSIA
jgi:cytochrome b6